MRERPPTFRINRNATLAKGLVFAGLGGGASTLMLADASGYGNHGTLTNMDPPTDWVWVPELNRWGVDIAQTGTTSPQHCKLAFVPTISQTIFSIAFWSRQAGGESVRDAFVLSNGYNLNYNGCFRCDNNYTNRWYLGCKNTTQFQLVGGGARTGLHHWCVVREGTSCTLYRDGVVDVSLTGGTAEDFGWGYSTSPIIGAATTAANTRQYGGGLTDFLIYDHALVVPKIQQLADPSNTLLSGAIENPRRKIL